MWQNAHDTYLEDRVLSADPIGLVRLLYQAATAAVREARHHLAAGEIAARSRSINRACDIVAELASSLDHQRGGEISRSLAQLYGYMTSRLIEANFQQADAPLADVLGLLSTLSEAWDGIQTQKSAAPAAGPRSAWAESLPGPQTETRSQAWSL